MTDFVINSAVLYRAGIGWFLASGESEGNSIYFPVATQDLNDFLKTSIISVEDGTGFNNLSFDTTTKENLFDSEDAFIGLLEFLRGSECMIEYARSSITGKLLGYQMMDQKGKYVIVSVLNEEGIHNIEADIIKKISPKNINLQNRLEEFLAGMISDNDEIEQKMLRIGLNAEGRQKVSVQFLTSIPAWKLSYRLVVGESSTSLQMYAIVDNSTLVDFVDASLTLSTKLPVSFTYDLSTPHHIQRQHIQRKSETGITVSTSQSSKRASRSMAMDDEDDFEDVDHIISGAGLSIGAASGGTRSEPAPAQFSSQAEVEASESVEFVLSNPVTIRKNESSMVPLAQVEVDAKQKWYFNQTNHQRHPFRILEFTNDLEFAIDEGPIAVMIETPSLPSYQGEAMTARIAVDDDALIMYALDRDIEIKHDYNDSTQTIGFEIRGYYYRKKVYRKRKYTFTVYNNSSEEIDLYLAIPKSSYKFVDDIEFRDSWEEYRVIAKVTSNYKKFEYKMQYESYDETRLWNYSLKNLEDLLKKLELSDGEMRKIREIATIKKHELKLQEELQQIEKQLKRQDHRRTQIISSLEVLEEGTSDQKVRSSYVKDLTEVDKDLRELREKQENLEVELQTLRNEGQSKY